MVIGALKQGDEIPGVPLRVLALQTREKITYVRLVTKRFFRKFPSFFLSLSNDLVRGFKYRLTSSLQCFVIEGNMLIWHKLLERL